MMMNLSLCEFGVCVCCCCVCVVVVCCVCVCLCGHCALLRISELQSEQSPGVNVTVGRLLAGKSNMMKLA
jgi:hypothetical protein